MKFVISLFICAQVQASPIHVFHERNPEDAMMIRQIFVQDYKIPEELMTVKGVKSCEEIKSGGKLDLCLKNNGDLYVVSVDREFINESLKIFLAP